MRAFNQLVFDVQVSGLAAVSTKDDFAELLGKADDLVLEVEVESSTGTLPTLTLDVFHCNSGKVYQAATNGTIITAESIATAPYRKIAIYAKTSTQILGSLVQLRITLGGTGPGARVRIWACGRTG